MAVCAPANREQTREQIWYMQQWARQVAYAPAGSTSCEWYIVQAVAGTTQQ
jgi:hypothetical protein